MIILTGIADHVPTGIGDHFHRNAHVRRRLFDGVAVPGQSSMPLTRAMYEHDLAGCHRGTYGADRITRTRHQDGPGYGMDPLICKAR